MPFRLACAVWGNCGNAAKQLEATRGRGNGGNRSNSREGQWQESKQLEMFGAIAKQLEIAVLKIYLQ